MSVITLITVQNTTSVEAVEVLSPALVRRQIEAVTGDIPPGAVKTGALGDAGVIEIVAECAAKFDFPLVVDPVMISKHGTPLLAKDACRLLQENLLPHAFLVTPNLEEAEILSGIAFCGTDSFGEMARAILKWGVGNVLIKGGHLEKDAADYLYCEGQEYLFSAKRIDTLHTHGTGCTFSAAITAELAKGRKLYDAVSTAKSFIDEAIRSNPGLGRGRGPVNHFAGYESMRPQGQPQSADYGK